MDFALSAEQEALRDAVTSTLGAEAPMTYVRRMIDDERGYTDELWAKLADLGWLGLLVPEGHGGLGLGLVDLVVVQEEMGKALFPGPYLSSAVMATSAAVALGAAELVPALDVTRKIARLPLRQTPARRLGPEGDQTDLLRRVVDDVTVALAAETVGACDQAFREAVDYAQHRVQFDRPIARFQVIRHKAVDMLHQLELARVGILYTAWASDVDDPQREMAVAMSKGYVGEASVFITEQDIQIHGGMGFTWDVDAHLFYRRVKQNDLLLGHQAWHRRRLADLVLASG